ncbi:MAG: fumarylacetoacetate hydrolase family protein [Candidatus Omnitrophota bacterium]|jgi:2-keto-4-pentenoate hydratase/2-oxohepta-3-ene-1,7-dioic acid hydratase in catechol pathway
MRILRFAYKGKQGWGIAEEEMIRVLRGTPFGKIEFDSYKIPLGKIRFLPPATPQKIVLAGLNYRDHAKELKMPIPDEPVLFLKPPTALIAHKQKILYPRGVTRLDYEAELAIVIKKEARNIPEAGVSRYILGYTCLNDVTARDLQKKDVQWTRAKSFDTFCPLGPWVETEIDPADLRVSAALNGERKQDSRTSLFIFPVGYLVSFVSRIMTLMPGDVISTGTPPGVGPVQAGDTIEVEIEGIGKLSNKVEGGI